MPTPNGDKFDAEAIRRDTDLLELASRYVDLKKEGAEYVGLCPFHADTTRPGNFKVNPQKQVWACFACGAHEEHGADAIGFLMKAESIEFPEACRRLLNGSGTAKPPSPIAQPELKKPPPRVTCPPPEDAPPAPLHHKQYGDPTGTWTYRTAAGALLGYVCRWDTDAGKEYRCITWGKQGALPACWERKHFSDEKAMRPIYGLDRLAQHQNKQVLICEGEKAADAAAALFPAMVAISWAGGANAVNRTDWSPLKGRKAVLWPDNDEPGIAAMGKLAGLLQPICPEIKGLRVTDMAAGWDAADWSADMPDPMTWAKPRVFTYFAAQPIKTSQDAPPDTNEPTDAEPLTDAPTVQISTPSPIADTYEALATNEKGGLLMNLDNAVRAIESENILKNHIWYDEFLDSIMTDWNGPERQWKDADDKLLCLFLQRHVGLNRISVNQAHDAAEIAAFHYTRNECRDWLNGLQWDETERLPYMLSDGFGAEHDAYAQAVGRCWMVSIVARVMHPGCKVDTVPVLEGGQGIGKSSGLAIIGGKWFVECHENVMGKDFYGVLNGHMLVEISEMHSFSRAEVERIKGIISCQVDRYRKAYGRNTEDHPRHTVLVCTTNRDDWQKDETGARRFWPVKCGDINLHYLKTNRDQLFAEAVHRYRAGEKWWDVPAEDQKEQTNNRRDVDAWEPAIEQWLTDSARNSVQVGVILEDCLGIEIKEHDILRQKRVSRILRALGWVNKVRRDTDCQNRRMWVRDDVY